MKVVILAGGYGTRLSEETEVKPKPMVEVGGKPILWHILKIFSSQGFNDFVICLGYKGEKIREYFRDLYHNSSDLTYNLDSGNIAIHSNRSPAWNVTLVDTGVGTLTGGRLRRVRDYLDDEFMMTYGDGVANVNLGKLLDFHKAHGKIATVTAVRPPARFGTLDIDDSGRVMLFREKQDQDGTWINGGFFVLRKSVFDYIDEDEPHFEDYPMRRLSKDDQLYAFRHRGFWRPMDTLSDKKALDDLWNTGKAEWKIWQD